MPFIFIQGGQVTDDSELVISLGRGILNSNEGVIDQEMVTKQYSDWVSSGPFDIGNTTYKGLEPMKNIKPEVRRQLIEKRELSLLSSRSATHKSNANVGLMRSTPLALLGLHLACIEDLRALVKMDHSFTHPMPINIEAATNYLFAIVSLIKKGDPDLAIAATLEYIGTCIKDEKTSEEIMGFTRRVFHEPAWCDWLGQNCLDSCF
jgi:ADP-ribosylglycohydrolase